MAELIFPRNSADAKRLSRLFNKGALKRIRQGIYTDGAWEDIPQLLQNRWHEVVHALFPGAIASHATAALLTPQNKVVHITADVQGWTVWRKSSDLSRRVGPNLLGNEGWSGRYWPNKFGPTKRASPFTASS